ncbi:hypothetical protein P43SY_011321 [Pythium insidiosum]|uniref:Ubiquitin-like protease family profile domain-containing protein n=1 Tax=Pythium insidiosum TaxID=114742 RepID=A0AAD5L869_PYTIN|nr:hypothetical protein P43SY_011321 [Pythium insidiosum]
MSRAVDHDTKDSDFEDASVRLQVKLNPRARKTGRPPIAKSQTVSRAKRERLHFNQSESARRELGEVTLFDLAKSLDEEKPSVVDTLKRLEKIPTKFMQCENKKAKFLLEPKPVLNMDAFYLLPKKLAAQKRVSYYDSLNANMYKNACDDLAQVIVKDALPDFSVVSINSHIQFDGFSCGFYVGMKIWSYVDHTIPKDLTQHSINARHFELLNFILTGEKPIQKQAIARLPPSHAVLNVAA